MPAAVPTINGVAGSNADLPISTLVQLNNTNAGGELTYSWAFLDQPTGTADTLSASNIQNPTFTPTKEGSYLLELVVNAGMVTEQRAKIVVGIKELRSGIRVPAAGETTEVDGADGWAPAVNAALRAGANQVYDGTVLGVLAGGVSAGAVVYASGRSTLKSGLPGEEVLPTFTVAPASTAALVGRPLGVVESGVAGVLTAGAVVRARTVGRIAALGLAGAVVGDPLYVSDAGALALAPGTNVRQVGVVMWTNGTICDGWLDTTSGAFANPRLYATWMTGPVDAEALPQTFTFDAAAGITPTVEIIGSTGGAGTDQVFYVHSAAGAGAWGHFQIDKEGQVTFGSDGAITAEALLRFVSRAGGTTREHFLQTNVGDIQLLGPGPAGSGLLLFGNYETVKQNGTTFIVNGAASTSSPSGARVKLQYASATEEGLIALEADSPTAGEFVLGVRGYEYDGVTPTATVLEIGSQMPEVPVNGIRILGRNAMDSASYAMVWYIDAASRKGWLTDVNAPSDNLTDFEISFFNLILSNVSDPANDAAGFNWGYAKENLAPAVLLWGANAAPAAGVTRYLYPGYSPAAGMTTEIVRWRAPAAGKVSQLYVRANAASVGGSWTVTARKNGADTALTATLAAAATTGADTTHSFTVAAGDELTVSVASAGGVGTPATEPTVSALFTLA